jgi:dihydrolipoamide dehydrogenase
MKVDTVIVGAGSAGLSALREVRHYTDDFLVVNDGHWGTTCAAVGCMPSKALIEAANAFHCRLTFEEFGVQGAEGLRADIPAVLARVRRMRDGFVKGPESLPDKLGDRAVSGRARLLGPGRLEVNDDEIEARAIILAPGSRPVVPGPWRNFGDRILTTDSLFEQDDLPRRIAVVGMGAIGVEMAQALARLGLDVAGFDAAETLAGIDDRQVLEAFRPLIEAEMGLHAGASAELEDAGRTIRVSGAGGVFEADAVLVAIGRRPNIDGLGLDTLGVPLDDKGMPRIDPATLRIGDMQVFLAGDANGYRPLLHEAADEGISPGAWLHRMLRILDCAVVRPCRSCFHRLRLRGLGLLCQIWVKTPPSRGKRISRISRAPAWPRQPRACCAFTPSARPGGSSPPRCACQPPNTWRTCWL